MQLHRSSSRKTYTLRFYHNKMCQMVSLLCFFSIFAAFVVSGAHSVYGGDLISIAWDGGGWLHLKENRQRTTSLHRFTAVTPIFRFKRAKSNYLSATVCIAINLWIKTNVSVLLFAALSLSLSVALPFGCARGGDGTQNLVSNELSGMIARAYKCQCDFFALCILPKVLF